eukprot:279277-Karenia_brevis.AAC.1
MKAKDYAPELLAVALKQRLQKQKGARVLQGIAPMGDLERKLQEFLDKEKVEMILKRRNFLGAPKLNWNQRKLLLGALQLNWKRRYFLGALKLSWNQR